MYMYTQRFLHLEAQQFLVVFIRCGGYEKKKKSLPSFANGFGTLCTSRLWESCNLTSRLFIDAPSNVTPITYSSILQ